MKYCNKCKREFETEEDTCPICGAMLIDVSKNEQNEINEDEAAEIISTMMITGIL